MAPQPMQRHKTRVVSIVLPLFHPGRLSWGAATPHGLE